MVTASCGHQLTEKEDMGISMATKDYERDGSRAVTHGVYCDKCAKEYRDSGLTLYTNKQQNYWLFSDTK